jgi:hypothetical protein
VSNWKRLAAAMKKTQPFDRALAERVDELWQDRFDTVSGGARDAIIAMLVAQRATGAAKQSRSQMRRARQLDALIAELRADLSRYGFDWRDIVRRYLWPWRSYVGERVESAESQLSRGLWPQFVSLDPAGGAQTSTALLGCHQLGGRVRAKGAGDADMGCHPRWMSRAYASTSTRTWANSLAS